jgi:hypothetical protein
MKDNRVWRKSSYSGGQGNCVEVAVMPGNIVAVRDSKDRAGAELIFSGNAWTAFVMGSIATCPVAGTLKSS